MFRQPHIPVRNSRRSRRGFTLIEILLVIAVIGILASITFGVSNGIRGAQNRARAKSELAVLAQSIEQFKLRKGDYPWTQGGEVAEETLLKALLGWKEFERSGADTDFEDITDVPSDGPKSFIDTAQFLVSSVDNPDRDLPTENTARPDGLVFMDPWGEPYVYKYKDTDSWENFGFVLYSKGPDGLHTAVGADGVITRENRQSDDNLDNIYPGE
ncbi:MAG: prepilin-type N-terminal cleavage/methylation domain-containing protein [Coraliomargaritaceae bacterium]